MVNSKHFKPYYDLKSSLAFKIISMIDLLIIEAGCVCNVKYTSHQYMYIVYIYYIIYYLLLKKVIAKILYIYIK